MRHKRECETGHLVKCAYSDALDEYEKAISEISKLVIHQIEDQPADDRFAFEILEVCKRVTVVA